MSGRAIRQMLAITGQRASANIMMYSPHMNATTTFVARSVVQILYHTGIVVSVIYHMHLLA